MNCRGGCYRRGRLPFDIGAAIDSGNDNKLDII